MAHLPNKNLYPVFGFQKDFFAQVIIYLQKTAGKVLLSSPVNTQRDSTPHCATIHSHISIPSSNQSKSDRRLELHTNYRKSHQSWMTRLIKFQHTFLSMMKMWVNVKGKRWMTYNLPWSEMTNNETSQFLRRFRPSSFSMCICFCTDV